MNLIKILLFLVCVSFMRIESQNLNIDDCIFGPLDGGVLSWGLSHGFKTIPGSTMNSYNGTDTINNFITLYHKFPETVHVCFTSKIKICESANDVQYDDCMFGPLSHGVALWGISYEDKRIAGSLSVTDNGTETILKFTELYKKYSDADVICFNPKRINC